MMAAIAESAFGLLLHGLADGVEIVTGGDDGKEQNDDTTERAHEGQRGMAGMCRRELAAPQRVGGQQ